MFLHVALTPLIAFYPRANIPDQFSRDPPGDQKRGSKGTEETQWATEKEDIEPACFISSKKTTHSLLSQCKLFQRIDQ